MSDTKKTTTVIDKDLATDPYTATSVFIGLLPTIESLKGSPLHDKTKLSYAKNLIWSAVNEARDDCAKERPNEPNSMGQKYIDKVRTNLENNNDLDDLISYMNNAIAKGRVYQRKTTK